MEDEITGSILHTGYHSFEWSKLHLPTSKTGPLRHEYDTLGSTALEQLQALAKADGSTNDPRKRPDLYQLLANNHDGRADLQKLWTQLHTVPDWVNWEQLQRGQRFFYRYAAANLMGFALQGFVGENSSSSGAVEVLVRTGGFSTRILLHRLLETFQWLLQVTNDLDSIKPGGSGHVATIRVRLLHALVRQRILKLAETRPQYFNVREHGIPINNFDSIHSISIFCCNHMWLQLPRMGIYPTAQEKEDYIALFRYLAYLIGTPDDYFVSVEQAKATMESILVNGLQITETSRVLCFNFIKCLEDLPPLNISREFIEAGSRVLNGDQMCDELHLNRPGWIAYACFTGHCWLVMALAMVQRLIPAFDSWVIKQWRSILHSAIIQSGLKGASKFDFKYLPAEGFTTGKETVQRQAISYGIISRPVEAFYLSVFVLGITVASLLCLVFTRIAWALLYNN